MPLKPEKTKFGTYRIRGTVYGIRVQRSSGTRSLEEAKQVAAAWERQLFEEHVLGKRQVETFAEVAVDYLRAGHDLGNHAETIILELGEIKTDRITQAEIERLATIIYPNGAAPATINRWVIAPISALMNWAAASDRAPRRSFKRRRVRNAKTDWRRPGEIEEILAAFEEPATRALAALYVGCGLRASEAVFLDGREVAPDLSRVRILGRVRSDDAHAKLKGYKGTKSGKDRAIDIPPRARQLIAPFINTGAGRALRNSRGEIWHGKAAIAKTLRKACARAGVEPMGVHVLRHTFATWHNAVHGDPIRLMSAGGWSSLSLVERYAHAGDDLLADEVINSGWAVLPKHDPRASNWSVIRQVGNTDQ